MHSLGRAPCWRSQIGTVEGGSEAAAVVSVKEWATAASGQSHVSLCQLVGAVTEPARKRFAQGPSLTCWWGDLDFDGTAPYRAHVEARASGVALDRRSAAFRCRE